MSERAIESIWRCVNIVRLSVEWGALDLPDERTLQLMRETKKMMVQRTKNEKRTTGPVEVWMEKVWRESGEERRKRERETRKYQGKK